MIPSLHPIHVVLALSAFGCGLSAAAVTLPQMYQATTASHATFDLNSPIFLAGGDYVLNGTAEVTATLLSGHIRFDEVQGSIPSETWSGSGSFVNSSFQTVNVSLTIVTNPTSFVIASGQSIPLEAGSNGTLQWGTSPAPVTTSGFHFSGSWTLQGPTQTVTGTFSHQIQTHAMISDGLMEVPNFPAEISLAGGLHAFFPESFRDMNLPLVNGTVDGVSIAVNAFGVRSGMGASFGNVYGTDRTVFQAVPEPGAAALACIAAGGTLLLRRRRGAD